MSLLVTPWPLRVDGTPDEFCGIYIHDPLHVSISYHVSPGPPGYSQLQSLNISFDLYARSVGPLGPPKQGERVWELCFLFHKTQTGKKTLGIYSYRKCISLALLNTANTIPIQRLQSLQNGARTHPQTCLSCLDYIENVASARTHLLQNNTYVSSNRSFLRVNRQVCPHCRSLGSLEVGCP